MPTRSNPDIVLIHCHDLGRWLSIYGMPAVPSTHLARLAETAMVFENAHSVAPLCSPARGALFTGISPHRNGIQGLTHHAWRYREAVITAPERLAAAGYHSTLIGLQHENTDPAVLGFDEVAAPGYLPRVNKVVQDAEAWLVSNTQSTDRAPIFLTVGVWEVHRPWPHEDYEQFDPETVDVPDYLPDNEFTRADIADFYGSIKQMDAGIGRLLDTVDETLDPENTIIIFTTDHGAAFPRAKSSLYDAGTGVSLIIRPPTAWQCAPGRISNIVSHLDVVPTLLDLADLPVDDTLEGVSLVELLQTRRAPEDRVLVTSKSFHDTYDPIRAVRSVDYTYIRNLAPGPKLSLSGDLEQSLTRKGFGDEHLQPRPAEELYDRRVDAAELENRIEDPALRQIRQQYSAFLDQWMIATADTAQSRPPELPSRRSREVDALPAGEHVTNPLTSII